MQGSAPILTLITALALISSSGAGLARSIVPADSHGRLAPVLPEVTHHLERGLAEVEAGASERDRAEARAHARLVLLEDRVAFSVDMTRIPEKQRKKCLETLRSAMDEWTNDLEQRIQFVPVKAGDTPELVVRFEPTVLMQHEQVAGYVNWLRTLDADQNGNFRPVFTADLQIRTQDLRGNTMPTMAMRHAVMHELGHVLGLDDSPKEGDVMGPLNVDHPVSAPTSLEVETVKSLRAQAQVILEKASPTAVTVPDSATTPHSS